MELQVTLMSSAVLAVHRALLSTECSIYLPVLGTTSNKYLEYTMMQQFMLSVETQMFIPSNQAVLQVTLSMDLGSTPLQTTTNPMTSIRTNTQVIY